jgi:sulfite exporter TauE/SafE
MNALMLASAWLMGLLGSSHCVAMCGGVVAMTCSALPVPRRSSLRAQLPYVLAYNAGRIASYATAGAIAGALGATLASLGLALRAQLGLRLVAGGMMIAVGLYVAGWGRSLRWVERVGEPVWKRIAPLAGRLVPIATPPQAFALGLLWGWLPCGLVYAAIAAAVTSGSAIGGAATMVAFGLGTLPMLLAMGSAAAMVARSARIRWVRTAAGSMILVFGIVQLVHTGRAWAASGTGPVPVCCAGHHGQSAGPL